MSLAPLLRSNEPEYAPDPREPDAVAPFLDTEALCNWLRDSAEFTEAVDRGWLDRIAYRLQIKGDISAARPDELLCLAIIDEVPEVRLLALDALRARFLGREAA